MLSLDCEMSAVHGLLSKIPDTLSYEQVMVVAHQLFEKHSPKKLAKSEGLKLSARCCIDTPYIFTHINKWQMDIFQIHKHHNTQFLPMKVSVSEANELPQMIPCSLDKHFPFFSFVYQPLHSATYVPG